MTTALPIDSEKWKQIVCDGAGQMGILLDKPMLEKMAAHCIELIRWNKKVNLTAITDPMEVAVKHVLDSLAALPLIPDGAFVLDVGSGGGFPGMALKIANPGLSVVLVEASRKKFSFLNQVIRMLCLSEIEAVHARVEETGFQRRFAGTFDVAVCRAFTSLSGFVAEARSLVAENGFMIAYKGRKANREIENPVAAKEEKSNADFILQAEFSIDVRSFRLPYLNLERSLIRVKRK